MRDVEIIQPFEGTVVIGFHGEHDRLTCEQLRELLTSEITSNDVVVVDVNDAEFIDSMLVSKVIELSGVLHDIEWVDSGDTARSSFAYPSRVAEGVPA